MEITVQFSPSSANLRRGKTRRSGKGRDPCLPTVGSGQGRSGIRKKGALACSAASAAVEFLEHHIRKEVEKPDHRAHDYRAEETKRT